nr:hypothetical protein [Bifidobacterium pseudolongum]
MTMMMFCPLACSVQNTSSAAWELCELSAPVGSSANTSSGSLIRARTMRALGLATGDLCARARLGAFVEVHEREQFARFGGNARLGAHRERAGDDHVVDEAHAFEQLVLLEHEAAVCAVEHGERVVAHAGDGFAVEFDGAGGGALQTGERVEQSRFACAGGAHDRGEVAAADVHVESVEHGLFTVGRTERLGQSAGADDCGAGRRVAVCHGGCSSMVRAAAGWRRVDEATVRGGSSAHKQRTPTPRDFHATFRSIGGIPTMWCRRVVLPPLCG